LSAAAFKNESSEKYLGNEFGLFTASKIMCLSLKTCLQGLVEAGRVCMHKEAFLASEGEARIVESKIFLLACMLIVGNLKFKSTLLFYNSLVSH
jgi:hypothetical protein